MMMFGWPFIVLSVVIVAAMSVLLNLYPEYIFHHTAVQFCVIAGYNHQDSKIQVV
jgi:hypothetical protein